MEKDLGDAESKTPDTVLETPEAQTMEISMDHSSKIPTPGAGLSEQTNFGASASKYVPFRYLNFKLFPS
jgi:hypothetical protein